MASVQSITGSPGPPGPPGAPGLPGLAMLPAADGHRAVVAVLENAKLSHLVTVPMVGWLFRTPEPEPEQSGARAYAMAPLILDVQSGALYHPDPTTLVMVLHPCTTIRASANTLLASLKKKGLVSDSIVDAVGLLDVEEDLKPHLTLAELAEIDQLLAWTVSRLDMLLRAAVERRNGSSMMG